MRRIFGLAAFGASVVFATAGVLLTTATSDWIANLIVGVWLCAFGAMALLIVLRTDNMVGILMLMFTLLMTLSLASASYGQYVYEFGHRSLPFGQIAAWLSLWLPLPAMGLLIFVFLRFPNGDLLSPRWRHVERLAIVTLAIGALSLAFRPGGVDSVKVAEPGGFGEANLPNPLGVESFESFSRWASTIGGILLNVLVLATIVSLVLRFRRAQGPQRRQMKWLVLTVGLFPVFFLLAELVGTVDPTEEEVFTFLTIMFGAFLVPVGMGISILKYRLYDIDVIVNRTLVYGALTALLVAAYAGLVFGLQLILEPLTEESDLAVAGSTLMVAALFRPLRTRVQSFIDRRFYRQKYDSARTLSAFATRLRDEVDLEVVERDVVAVLHETVQPAHAAIWVKAR